MFHTTSHSTCWALDIQPFCDKESLQVMKFVFLHSTYILSVLNMGLNITSKNEICVFTIGFLSISTEYGLKCDSRIGMK